MNVSQHKPKIKFKKIDTKHNKNIDSKYSHKKKNKERNKHHRDLINDQKKTKIINERVSNLLNKTNLDKVAKESGYLIRKSPITPFIFIYTLAMGLFGVEISLDLLAINMNSIFGTDLTGCAFSIRMGEKKSVAFLKSCFERYLTVQLELAFENKFDEVFSMFKAVILEDSTVIELNEKVGKSFKGSGGAASKSSAKLNWVFNICCFSVIAVDIFSGSTPDRKYAEKSLKYVRKGMLVVRDLGYFVISNLRLIEKKGAYYLSRVHKGVLIYENEADESPLNVNEFFKKSTFGGKSTKTPIFLGKQERFSTHLILQKVPKWVLNQRIKQYKKKNSGKLPSNDFITWAKYSVFITNIPEELVSNCSSISFEDIVIKIYKIRWQIELLFKKLKSKVKLSFIKGKNKNRVLCLIYGKLIATLLSLMILSYAASKNYRGREISLWKVITWLVSGGRLANAILKGTLDRLYLELCKQFKLLCKDKRKRGTALDILQEVLPLKRMAA